MSKNWQEVQREALALAELRYTELAGAGPGVLAGMGDGKGRSPALLQPCWWLRSTRAAGQQGHVLCLVPRLWQCH